MVGWVAGRSERTLEITVHSSGGLLFCKTQLEHTHWISHIRILQIKRSLFGGIYGVSDMPKLPHLNFVAYSPRWFRDMDYNIDRLLCPCFRTLFFIFIKESSPACYCSLSLYCIRVTISCVFRSLLGSSYEKKKTTPHHTTPHHTPQLREKFARDTAYSTFCAVATTVGSKI